MTKALTVSEAGKRGGRTRTRLKRAAARANLRKARRHLLTKRLCRVCRKNHLGHRNKTGICRSCQRAGKS